MRNDTDVKATALCEELQSKIWDLVYEIEKFSDALNEMGYLHNDLEVVGNVWSGYYAVHSKDGDFQSELPSLGDNLLKEIHLANGDYISSMNDKAEKGV